MSANRVIVQPWLIESAVQVFPEATFRTDDDGSVCINGPVRKGYFPSGSYAFVVQEGDDGERADALLASAMYTLGQLANLQSVRGSGPAGRGLQLAAEIDRFLKTSEV